MTDEKLVGKWPAIVREWDRDRRECRVEIPGLTNGAEVFPLAEIAYPIGDKSEHTEIWIEVGDRIWVEFERGDARYPIITHYRTKRLENEQLWRRFEHENHERAAFDGDIYDNATQDIRNEAGRDHKIDAFRDIITEAGRNETKQVGEVYQLTANSKIELIVGGTKVELTNGLAKVTTNQFTVDAPNSTFTGNLLVQGASTMQGALAAQGGAAVSGGGMTHNGKNIGDNHNHAGSPTAPNGPVSNTGNPV